MPMLLGLLSLLLLAGPAGAQESETTAEETDDTAKPTRGMEEIVITSQGMETPLQEASISVAAFDEQYLQALGAQNIQDISQFTPNLEIRSPYAATNPTLFIRGVGLRDFNANSSSAVAVYNDGVYMNSPVGQLAQLFDIQQLEILRGPQGALYGRNASAGAILVHSRRPVGDTNGYTRFTYGRFNQREVEGAFELPLVQDLLSMRIAGRMNLKDGYTKNRCGDARYAAPPADPANETFRDKIHGVCFNGKSDPVYEENPITLEPVGPPLWAPVGTTTPVEGGGWGWKVGEAGLTPEWVNDVDNWAGRFLLRFQPNEQHDWLLNVHGGNNDGDARQFQNFPVFRFPDGELRRAAFNAQGYRDYDSCSLDSSGRCPGLDLLDLRPNRLPADGDPYAGDYDFVLPDDVDLFGTSLTGNVYLGDFRIRSVTGYESNRRKSGLDLDGSSLITIRVYAFNEAKQVSEDLRIYWDNGGPFTWQAGGNFLYEKLKVDNDFSLLSTSLFNRQFYEQETLYGSAYAYMTWAISETFSIEGGARWNVDHRDFKIGSSLRSLQTGRSASGAVESTQFTEDAPTGDISITYKPYEGVNFYAKFSRGWKGPHINGLILNTFEDATELADGGDLLEPVKPETVTAGEIGVKSMWWDQRIRVNGAAFYYDYDDIQVFQIRNSTAGFPLPTLLSANDAELFGAELEVEIRPLEGWAPASIEGLQLFLSGSWLEGQYNDFEDIRADPGVPGNIILDDFSGNQLINAPKYSFIGYVQWPLEISNAGTLIPRFDWAYKSRIYFGAENLELVSQESLWLLNLRMAWVSPNQNIEVAGWVRNLSDEIYYADAIDLSRLANALAYAMGEPRTYGVTLELRF